MNRACIGLITVFLLSGCQQQTSPPPGLGETGEPLASSGHQESVPGDDQGWWVEETWNGAISSGGQTVEDTTQWLNRMYQTARDQGLTTATSVKDWVTSDLQSMGDWEYKLLTLSPTDPVAIERQLNELGQNRWECFHVAESGDNWTLLLKRSKRSLLSRIPLRDLVNVLPAIGGDGEQ